VKRYGPLIAVPEALAVGDPGRHHLRLTRDAILVRNGIESMRIISWDQIERITLSVPTTRFRLPGMVGTVFLGALAALTMSDLGVEPEDGVIEITVSGETTATPLSRHHVGGYWGPTVTGAHRVLQYLIDSPAQRTLLARPEALIEVAARLARRSAEEIPDG
jgi:hypothetical protein